MNRYCATMRHIIDATIVAIATHPKIVKPEIFHPLNLINGRREEVKIERWRSYGGAELEESQLTCAVYPMFGATNALDGAPSTRESTKSVTFDPYNLGGRDPNEATGMATYRLVVQLFYQEVAIGTKVRTHYRKIKPIDGVYSEPMYSMRPHGFSQMQVPDSVNRGDDTTEVLNTFSLPPYEYLEEGEISIEINPAEQVLREYMDLLRLVLEDVPALLPYHIRSTFVKDIDYPTSSWSKDNENVYFHTAYLTWELTAYPPLNWNHWVALREIY